MSWSKFRFIIQCAAVLILGIPLIIFSVRDKIELANTADISKIEAEELHKGQYVSGTVSQLWGTFASVESLGVTEYYFALPLEATLDDFKPKFVAIAFKDADDIAAAKKMAQEQITGGRTTMRVIGRVSKPDSDILEYFHNYIEREGKIWYWYAGEIACDYVIEAGNDGSGSTWRLIAGIVITLAGLVGMLPTVVLKLRKKRRPKTGEHNQ